jgi:hypothetical protein
MRGVFARWLHGLLPLRARRAAPRPRPLRALIVPLLAALAACGGEGGAPLSEPWPITLPDPAVLGYMAARLRPDETEQIFQVALGWAPAGLRPDAPIVGVRFDSKSFGGPMGFLLPLADEAAFRASLAAAPGLESLGDGKYRLSVAPDSGLGMLLHMTAGLEAGNPVAMLQSLGNAATTTFPFQVEVRDGWALAVPSLEALGVGRRFLAATHGFAGAPPHDLVVSSDWTRLRLVYAEELRKLEDQLRSLLSGARMAGAFGILSALGDDLGGGSRMPLNWELLWALKSMLEISSVEAVQLQVTFNPGRASFTAGGAPASPRDARDDDFAGSGLGAAALSLQGFMDLFRDVPHAAVRVQLADGSAVQRVAGALAPAPAVDGTFVAAGADPAAFPSAFAEWFRPVGEVVHGKGPPCDRWLTELAGLLSAWGGRCAIGLTPADDGFVLATLAPGKELDRDALQRWIAPLLSTARLQPADRPSWLRELLEGRITTEPDGRQLVRTASGEAIAACGRRGDVFWCVGDPDATAPESLCDALERAPPADTAGGAPPVVRLDLPWAAVHVTVEGRELTLHWLLDGRGG